MASRHLSIARLLSCAACVSGLILTGCGSASAGRRGAAGTRADFVAEAGRVCAATAKIGGSIRQPRDEAQLVVFFQSARSVARSEVAKLSALHPPSGKAGAYARYLAGLEEGVRLLERAAAAARRGEKAQVRAIVAEGNSLTQRNIANARSAGLQGCAKEG